MRRLVVLRLGHRRVRDRRVTTHCALVARAFGADSIFYSGDEDDSVKRTGGYVRGAWGGDFSAVWCREPYSLIREWRSKGGVCVHCTMYGMSIVDRDEELRRVAASKDVMVVVGAGKVPAEVYRLADYNIAIGHQPHSEIAALALLLDRVFQGKELVREFVGPRLRIVPQEHGKMVVQADG